MSGIIAKEKKRNDHSLDSLVMHIKFYDTPGLWPIRFKRGGVKRITDAKYKLLRKV
jgi:hypothetical protein